MKPVIIITGPTAVGKTQTTIEVAKHLNTEVISCDAIQIYKDLDIGSAKPTEEERQGILHHLIDFLDPFETYSVSDYKKDASRIINDLHKQAKVPIITGGTGLYINSLLYQMDFAQTPKDDSKRAYYENYALDRGNQALYDLLKERAPESLKGIHPNNVKRMVRALEILDSGFEKGDFSKDLVANGDYDFLLIVLDRSRQELYERINKRVDIMMDHGLLDEVKTLSARGLTPNHQSMKGIGYKELLMYLDGQGDLEDAVANIQQHSRRYAKRQLTWFRRYEQALWKNINDFKDQNALINDIIESVNAFLIK